MINEEEFLEMMCPDGYRAHVDAKRCRDNDGNELLYIDTGGTDAMGQFRGWTLVDGKDSDPW